MKNLLVFSFATAAIVFSSREAFATRSFVCDDTTTHERVLEIPDIYANTVIYGGETLKASHNWTDKNIISSIQPFSRIGNYTTFMIKHTSEQNILLAHETVLNEHFFYLETVDLQTYEHKKSELECKVKK